MMRNFSLQILRSTPEDEGGYKCIATNAGGSSEGGIHLIVQCRPIFYHVISYLPVFYFIL